MLKAIAFLSILLLFGCNSYSVKNRIDSAYKIAELNNLKAEYISSQNFDILTFSKFKDRNKPVNIYIEGDGFSWASSGRQSINPTPKNPVSLKLAKLDDSPNILYIGRPCQYKIIYSSAKCDKKYWHHSQYSDEVISSTIKVIDRFKQKYSFKKIHIIGYSGGANVASIIAAKRDDIDKLITVAGNLNHVEFNNYHNVTQLNDSLNANDFINNLKNIPQLHISGNRDKIIPEFISVNFNNKINKAGGCSKIMNIDSNHISGWQIHWKRILYEDIQCEQL